jgi:hypothetical protein
VFTHVLGIGGMGFMGSNGMGRDGIELKWNGGVVYYT